MDALDPRSFHSRYDPYREAERFVDDGLRGKAPSLVVIIGGGVNHIVGALRKRLPNARLVSLQPCADFAGIEAFSADFDWNPSSLKPLPELLTAAFSPEYSAAGVAVLEWPPIARSFPKPCSELREAVAAALRAAASDMATVAYWSRRWLANSVKFAGAVVRTASIEPGAGQIVVACAGPSLLDYADALRERRASFSLWALASAAEALASRGLRPDLVIASDPGFWNAYHLRAAAGAGVPLALCPSACAPAGVLERTPIIPLDTGLEFERLGAEALGRSPARVSAAGSAAGTAISLALRSTTGTVHVVGLDLAARGLDDHARPYPFDVLDQVKASRLEPAVSSVSSRLFDSFEAYGGRWRVSRAFAAYAATMGVEADDSSRVARYGDSPIDTSLVRGAVFSEALGRPQTAPAIIVDPRPLPAPAGRIERFIAGLAGAVKEAGAQARAARSSGVPLPRAAMVTFQALLGKAAAPAIARLARGEAEAGEIADLEGDAAAMVAGMLAS